MTYDELVGHNAMPAAGALGGGKSNEVEAQADQVAFIR